MKWVRAALCWGAVWSATGRAEAFVCEGTGRFAKLNQAETINLSWANEPTRVLMQTESTRVQVGLDRSTDQSLGFFKIEVYDSDVSGNKVHGAKGSMRDTVQYIDSVTSKILCLPLIL